LENSHERENTRCHKDMILDNTPEGIVTLEAARENYNRLTKEEKVKDTEPMECLVSMLKVYDGLRIYRLR